MRDVRRILKLLMTLHTIWAGYFPDYRFFQFMLMITPVIQHSTNKIDLFFLEDDELQSILDSIANTLAQGNFTIHPKQEI